MAQVRPSSGIAVQRAHPLLALADSTATDTADRLHDGAVQALVAARYAADAAVRGGDPVQARDAVQVALVQLRGALWHLRPRPSAAGGLAGALALMRRQLEVEARGPLDIDIDSDDAGSASFASLAYRLVQAVALPADAGHVFVVVRRDGPQLQLDLSGGAALAQAGVWAAAAHTLGGSLTESQGPPHAVCLRMPVLDHATEGAR